VVEWLTLLLHIREFPASNIGPQTSYPDYECYPWFSSVPPGKCRGRTLQLGHDRFLLHPFQFIHLSPFHSSLSSLSCYESGVNNLQINTVNNNFTAGANNVHYLPEDKHLPCLLLFRASLRSVSGTFVGNNLLSFVFQFLQAL
jgi:hypothetical protein